MHIVNKGAGLPRRVAAALLFVVSAVLLVVPAGSAAAAGASPGSPPAQIAAVCHYWVNGDGVAVRRAPDPNAHVIKRKNYGAHVTGPCVDYPNGRWWTQVHLGSGGHGWIASAYLVYRGYW